MQLPIFTRSLFLVFLLGCCLAGTEGFFFDKLDRFKKLTFPGFGSGGFGGLFGGMNNGVRVCINFSSNLNYPQGYQQNTCFICDSLRFNQIATYCTGQSTIPSNINYTQANCIMNSCQPAYGTNQRFPTTFLPNV